MIQSSHAGRLDGSFLGIAGAQPKRAPVERQGAQDPEGLPGLDWSSDGAELQLASQMAGKGDLQGLRG